MEHRKQKRRPAAGAGHDEADALVIYASQGKTALAALFFFAFGVTLVVLPRILGPTQVRSFYGNPTTDVLVQIVGVPLCGLGAIRMLTILFSRAPRIVVTHEGIWVASLLYGSAIIPWADIGALRPYGHRLPPVANLLIVLRTRDALRDRQTRLQVLLCWLGGQAVVWPQSVVTAGDLLLPMSITELVVRIRVRFEHELVLHGIRVQGARPLFAGGVKRRIFNGVRTGESRRERWAHRGRGGN